MIELTQLKGIVMGRLMPIKSVQDHDFQFTVKWFYNTNLATFRNRIYPVWKDLPISYVEIGVYEGMSLVWMMQHVLTHPDSHAIGIDPWLMCIKYDEEYMDAVRHRAYHNLSPWKDRCSLIRGNSVEVIGRGLYREEKDLKRGSTDICFVDGDHHELATTLDGELCLKLVRPGGWILFDQIHTSKKKPGFAQDGLELFLERNGKQVKKIWEDGRMEAYEKL